MDAKQLEEAIEHVQRVLAWTYTDAEVRRHLNVLLAAAEAHLATLPKTEEIEVWHVEWADGDIPHIDDPYLSREMAERGARIRQDEGRGQHIRVTGPHKQTVRA